jgi:hypothetical protein
LKQCKRKIKNFYKKQILEVKAFMQKGTKLCFYFNLKINLHVFLVLFALPFLEYVLLQTIMQTLSIIRKWLLTLLKNHDNSPWFYQTQCKFKHTLSSYLISHAVGQNYCNTKHTLWFYKFSLFEWNMCIWFIHSLGIGKLQLSILIKMLNTWTN